MIMAEKSIFETQEAQDKRFKPLVTDKGWICVPGMYKDGQITCKAPVLNLNQISTPLFEVDISING